MKLAGAGLLPPLRVMAAEAAGQGGAPPPVQPSAARQQIDRGAEGGDPETARPVGEEGECDPPPCLGQRQAKRPVQVRRIGRDQRALAVVLSGTIDDGATGVVALKRAGGCVLAQNRATARCFGMPAAAIATGCVDLVLPVDRIAHALLSLVAWPGAPYLLRAPLAAWAVLD